MTIQVAVLREREPGERRVAIVPDSVKRLLKAGWAVAVEAGAGAGAYFSDAAYAAAGATVLPDAGAVLRDAALVVTVGPPTSELLQQVRSGALVVGQWFAHRHLDAVRVACERRVTSFAMDLVPRVTRAQSMDVLSSQATVGGYRAVLLAASLSQRFFPMLTTAAGTIRPAQALILGAGVAGLQAIATARRLGAVVSAYDVRRATKEQVESLGARFVDLPLDAEAIGGYARELDEDERKQAEAVVAKHVANADVVIACAQVPGRPSPRLVTEEMVAHMKPGAVIVDLAAEGGGNCACTVPDQVVERHGVRIAGPLHILSDLAEHASTMYARNLEHFVALFKRDGETVTPPWDDEIIQGAALTHDGAVKHGATAQLLTTGGAA
ncbi:MAG: NAD(P) transhydrogenase subunit alpha [Deltaproteobacteria bacterium]|nr:NAD(P) transhydrogenase subunit alpha [Deltaproteobacteria bacterium]